MLSKRGIVTLVFDDGYREILENIVPKLKARQLHGVFAIVLDDKAIRDQEALPIATADEWLPLANQGHEIAAHTVTHRNLTSLSDEELDFELREPRAKLSAHTLVYPGGGFDDRVIAVVQKYYQAARTVRRGFEQLPPLDPWRLKTMNYSRRNFSLFKANLFAAWAYLNNLWLIETYHMVGLSTDKTHDVSGSDFERHLDWLTHLPLVNLTIKETLALYGIDRNNH